MTEDLENKILKFLILSVIVCSAVVLIKDVILKPKILKIPEIPQKLPQIKIDFEKLKSKEIKGLLPFEKITPPKEIGRENPFLPY